MTDAMTTTHKHFLTLALGMGLFHAAVEAKPRTAEQMRQAAAHALWQTRAVGGRTVPATSLQLLHQAKGYSIYGLPTSGFAVIAADDAAPAVLGYSESTYSTATTNTGFRWWVEAVGQVVEAMAQEGKPTVRTPKPDTSKHREAVAALCTSRWGQDAPFNNLCPMGTDATRTLTGCAATSTAQVLYYHKGPQHGMGTRTIYYPYNNMNGVKISVDFEKDNYVWADMTDTYGTDYTTVEADAVALLMRDCGVAANMQYGTDAQGGSGALHTEVAQGLQRYFGIADAKYIERADYTDEEWMDIIFDQVNRNQPLVYGGFDKSMGGHSFVIDGYNVDGLVHVNWGWNGGEDGYYDISLLNPTGYAFTGSQEAIIDIVPEPATITISGTADVATPGTLASLVDKDMYYNYDTLKVVGGINATDLVTLRDMAGRDINGDRTRGHLHVLDLTEARILAGDGCYLLDKGAKLTVKADNTLPDKLFHGCSLTSLLLPAEGIASVGVGAWAYCDKLESVSLTPTTNATFRIKDGFILGADTTQLIAIIPSRKTSASVPAGVKSMADYAFAGRNRLSHVDIDAEIEKIGSEAFANCWSLEELKVRSKDVPQLTGASVFAGASTEACRLAVRAGSKTRYSAAAQWKDFANITEFGTLVKARNTAREYGEPNPTLTYTVSGDKVEGVPEITCEATPTSTVGRYAIHIKRGTIEAADADFEDGYLVVTAAPLDAIASDTTRQAGEANPAFRIRYEGFKNGETPEVLLVQPTASCEANEQSPEGEYAIHVEGGEAENYEFYYIDGKLTVTANTAIRETRMKGNDGALAGHNVAGQRVITPSCNAKGVYIMRGRKVLVR